MTCEQILLETEENCRTYAVSFDQRQQAQGAHVNRKSAVRSVSSLHHVVTCGPAAARSGGGGAASCAGGPWAMGDGRKDAESVGVCTILGYLFRVYGMTSQRARVHKFNVCQAAGLQGISAKRGSGRRHALTPTPDDDSAQASC